MNLPGEKKKTKKIKLQEMKAQETAAALDRQQFSEVTCSKIYLTMAHSLCV